METPAGSGPPPGNSAGSDLPPEAGSSETFKNPYQGAAVTPAGVHVHVLHIVGLLPAPVAEVEKSYIQHRGMIKGAKHQHSSIFFTEQRRQYSE